MRLRFHGVDKVRELDGILDEEDGNIVSNDVPVSFFGVELQCKPTDVSNSVCGTSGTLNGGDSSEHGSCVVHVV